MGEATVMANGGTNLIEAANGNILRVVTDGVLVINQQGAVLVDFKTITKIDRGVPLYEELLDLWIKWLEGERL